VRPRPHPPRHGPQHPPREDRDLSGSGGRRVLRHRARRVEAGERRAAAGDTGGVVEGAGVSWKLEVGSWKRGVGSGEFKDPEGIVVISRWPERSDTTRWRTPTL